MSSEEKKDINDLLLELENIHHELKAFSARVETALATLQDFLDRVEKDAGIAKKIETNLKPVEGIKEAIEVKPQPVLAKPATKRQKLYIMDLAKKLNENLDLNKLSNMSAEDASVLIQQLKTKLEEKKVKGQ
jgi:DNA repair ATPase RecN